MSAPLLDVLAVTRTFDLSGGFLARAGLAPKRLVHAVDGVSLGVRSGRTFGLVGESGCGKSTLGRIIAGLLRPTTGQVFYRQADINAPGGAARPHRGLIQMVFQDPFSSVNPRWSVYDIIAEPMRRRAARDAMRLTKSALTARVLDHLRRVGLSEADAARFPHAFSGGQRQRIAIARALASEPELLICDEPTSALDVSVQAQILNLMKDLQATLGLTTVFISHDLAVVSHMADDVGVMYLGRIVETGPSAQVLLAPLHPYTRLLMAAVPRLGHEPDAGATGTAEIASAVNRPPGCHFHPRCPFADARCRTQDPTLKAHGTRMVACHAVEEGRLPA